MWNFNLTTICREHKHVFFDTGGLIAPVRSRLDSGQQKRNIELFVAELRLAEYWKIPHAVYDELFARGRENANLAPLVDIAREHTFSFEKTKATRFIGTKSVECANAHGISEYDRVAMSYAAIAATVYNERTAFITRDERVMRAFRDLRIDLGTDSEKGIAYKLNSKGVYAPVLEPIRIL
jgi:hypothetical protein